MKTEVLKEKTISASEASNIQTITVALLMGYTVYTNFIVVVSFIVDGFIWAKLPSGIEQLFMVAVFSVIFSEIVFPKVKMNRHDFSWKSLVFRAFGIVRLFQLVIILLYVVQTWFYIISH